MINPESVAGEIAKHFDNAFQELLEHGERQSPPSADDDFVRQPEIVSVPESIALQVFRTINNYSKISVELEKRFDDLDSVKSRIIVESGRTPPNISINTQAIVLENNRIFKSLPKKRAAVPVIGVSVKPPSSKDVFVECNLSFAKKYAFIMEQLVDRCTKGY